MIREKYEQFKREVLLHPNEEINRAQAFYAGVAVGLNPKWTEADRKAIAKEIMSIIGDMLREATGDDQLMHALNELHDVCKQTDTDRELALDWVRRKSNQYEEKLIVSVLRAIKIVRSGGKLIN